MVERRKLGDVAIDLLLFAGMVIPPAVLDPAVLVRANYWFSRV
jgi:SpoVK/Ycf46/Vps4 family AAA+-type ATPase